MILLLAVIIVLLATIVIGSQWTAHTPAITGADGKPLPGSIAALEKALQERSAAARCVRPCPRSRT